MSLLLDVLRKAEEGRQPAAAPAHAPPPAPQLALEALADAAPAAPAAATPQAPQSGIGPQPASATHGAPASSAHWTRLAASALAGATLAAAWLGVAPAPVPLTHASPPPVAVAPVTGPPAARQPPDPAADLPPPPPTRLPAGPPPAAAPPRPRSALRPPAASADAAVHFRRGTADTPPPRLSITRAHAAYTAGDLPLAGQLYRQALATDGNDIDALDGLGAIALRERRPADAEAFFRRALVVRPDDPVAVAGLGRLPGTDPRQTETRLRHSLADRPDSADNLALRLALADTLARQQRWAEAQQAWFQAHGLAPDDPDIAYNLAVSLDHLGQRRPAADVYRQALQLAARHPARFSRADCEMRLRALHGASAP